MSDQGKSDREIEARGTGGVPRGPNIERIVVALDPSRHSRAALEAAVLMAARLEAELLGLFVEDANVRRLAELPFAEEVGLFTASCRRVETHELSRQLSVQAGRVRRDFGISTRRVTRQCTFRIVRGRVAQEILKAAAEADVVILGKGAWSPFETGHLAPAVREVLRRTPASTLILRADARLAPPVRVVYDGSSLGEKAVRTAADLTADEDGYLVVFLLADDPDDASRLESNVREWLSEMELELSFQRLTEASVSRLAYLAAHEERGTLVLPAGAAALEDEAVLDFLDETRAPVLLIR